MKILLALCLLLVPSLASAQVAQTVCVNPCTLDVGQPFALLADSDGVNVAGFRVYLDGVKVGADLPASALANGTVTSFALTAPAKGAHTVALSAFNADGLEAVGPPLTFTVATAKPAPPANLRIVITKTNIGGAVIK